MLQQGPISSYTCFCVQKVSHHGILEIHQEKISFIFSGGEDFDNTHLDYYSIKKVIVEDHFAETMCSLEIHTDEQIHRFTGLREAHMIKDLIGLAQETYLKPKISYGFTGSSNAPVQWEDFENPVLLHSCTIPNKMDAVYERLLSKDFFYELYGSFGDEEIVIDDWSEKNGYKERKISFVKTLVLPVIGKSLVKVSETQHLYDLEKRKAIAVILNLGKTPYADCFDPQIQLVFEDNGDSVEFLAKFQIVWLSHPLVKSIIDNQTTSNIRIFYTSMGKQLLRELSPSVPKKKKKHEEEAIVEEKKSEDKFTKICMVYKLSIILLIAVLLFVIWYKYLKIESEQFLFFSISKLFVLIFFFVCLFHSSKNENVSLI